MSVIGIMLRSNPLPAFSSAGDVAEITICGETWVAVSRAASGTPISQDPEVCAIFKRLPRELKTKILTFAVEARTIHAIEVPVVKSAATPGGQVASANAATTTGAFKIIGAAMPSLLQVSREVMDLAGGMGYRPMFQVHGTNKTVYFNPYIDTLHVQTSSIRTNLIDQLELSNALVNPHELALVRYLRIPHDAFNIHTDNAVVDIGSMTRLQVLTLSGKFDVFPTQPDFTLKSDFEKSQENGGAIVVANIHGRRYEGIDASRLVEYWVPHTAAFAHIGEIYDKVDRFMSAQFVFPILVKLELRLAAAPMI